MLNKNKKYDYFLSVGKSLGDNVLFASFINYMKFISKNGDNLVIVDDVFQDLDNVREIYLNEDGAIVNKDRFKSHKVVQYDLFKVMKELSNAGYFPDICHYFEMKGMKLKLYNEMMSKFNSLRYVVLYMRNIKKAKGKNVKENTALQLLDIIKSSIKRKIIERAFIVGNDDFIVKKDDEIYENYGIIDRRKKTNLEEIAALCKECDLFIGSDGGIAHVASAAGCSNMITFNFTSEKYFPLTKYPSYKFLRGQENKFIQRVVERLIKIRRR